MSRAVAARRRMAWVVGGVLVLVVALVLTGCRSLDKRELAGRHLYCWSRVGDLPAFVPRRRIERDARPPFYGHRHGDPDLHRLGLVQRG